MKPVSAAISLVWLGTAGLAQQPLSAIEWLDESVTVPVVQTTPNALGEPPVSDSADIPDVTVLPLDAALPDSVGLLPSSITGLPETLWKTSQTSDLTALLSRIPPEPLPAVQALLYTLMLAEAEAPDDAGPDAEFLKTRIKLLVDLGAVEPAQALLERAGPSSKAIFDQWLDLTLLTGDEYKACHVLRDQPALSHSYAARIYCTALGGDWATAALTYETAQAVNFLSDAEEILLAQFLDPETIGLTPAPTIRPETMTPLLFRLFEAVGNPVPTHRLPRAYAMADLRSIAGWKAEIEAAERLARTGALPANRLLGIYTSRRPAASGGVWDRVAAVQNLDDALVAALPDDIATALPDAWEAMRSQGLEVAFSQLFAQPLQKFDLPQAVRPLTHEILLLSSGYEAAALTLEPTGKTEAFLIGLARGDPDAALATTDLERAIALSFSGLDPAAEHAQLLQDGKLGQAILAASIGLGEGTQGNLSRTTAALSTLRAVGLEDTARQAALQMLILKRP